MKKLIIALTALVLSANVASFAQTDTAKRVHHKTTTVKKTRTVSKDSVRRVK